MDEQNLLYNQNLLLSNVSKATVANILEQNHHILIIELIYSRSVGKVNLSNRQIG